MGEFLCRASAKQGTDPHWRNFPASHSFPWCWPIHRLELAVEHRNWAPFSPPECYASLLTVPRSSPSSRRTWSILTRVTCVLRSSSSGGVSARARLYTHTSLCPRQRYVLSLFWRTTCL